MTTTEINLDKKKALPSDTAVILTSETARLRKAKLLMEAQQKRKMLTQHDIPNFLRTQLRKLYDRVRQPNALNQDGVTAYLAKFAKLSSSVLDQPPGNKQKKLVKEFTEASKKIVTDISSEMNVSSGKLTDIHQSIEYNAAALNRGSLKDRVNVVENIGAKITEIASNTEQSLSVADLHPREKKEMTGQEMDALLHSVIVPIGLEGSAKRISVEDFFTFPLGAKDKTEAQWFDMHLQYLDLTEKKSTLENQTLESIKQLAEKLPRIKYKKYFQIFDNDEYEDSILMAVYSLFQNSAFKRLEVEA